MIGLFLLWSCSNPPEEEKKEEDKGISCLDACWKHFKDPRTSPVVIRDYFEIHAWPKYEECVKTAFSQAQTPFEAQCREMAVGRCNAHCMSHFQTSKHLQDALKNYVPDKIQ